MGHVFPMFEALPQLPGDLGLKSWVTPMGDNTLCILATEYCSDLILHQTPPVSHSAPTTLTFLLLAEIFPTLRSVHMPFPAVECAHLDTTNHSDFSSMLFS